MTRITIAAVLALAAVTPLAGPAAAQFYGGGSGYDDGYRRPRGYDDDEPAPRRRYDPRFDRDDRFDDRRGRGDGPNRFTQPQPGPGRGGPQGGPQPAPGGRGGGASTTCVTPRGSCTSTPMAVGGGCVCFVPGAGNVPGTVR